MKVDGCKVLVVGGARGIGRAVCELLASKGAHICIGDILEDVGKETAAYINATYEKKVAFFEKCDVQNNSDIKDLFAAALAKLGTLDVVIYMPGLIAESRYEDCIDVNLTGNIRVIETALKLMGKHCGGKGGIIINTASSLGIVPCAILPVYTATKHAIVGYTRSMAEPEHFTLHGVRINMVCPCGTDTTLFRTRDVSFPDKHEEIIAAFIAQGVMLKPSTVAEAYLQIIEDDSLNGQAIRVSHARGIEVYQFDTDHPIQ